MPTHCKPVSLAFQGCHGRRVTAAFDGGSITSNAGALLLGKADRSTGLFDRVAGLLHRPPRSPSHGTFGAHAGGAAHHRHFPGIRRPQ